MSAGKGIDFLNLWRSGPIPNTTLSNGVNGAAVAACAGKGPLPGGSRGDLNVSGMPLQPCRSRIATGFHRDGYCRTGPNDMGAHTVCAEVTPEFLKYTRSRGNDLETPRGSFPGLRPGDAWCLCAGRWREAVDAGVVLPARVDATEISALRVASIEELASGQTMK